MKQSLGQLPNAPLIYVLAQVAFNRVPKMPTIWESFHQRVFDRYPESEIEHVQQFTIQGEGLDPIKETRWHLLSRDRHHGLMLHANGLIFHTTSYSTSKDFIDEVAFAVEQLAEVLPRNIQVNRLGLRYIDLLLPQQGLTVDDQVVDTLRMLRMDSIGCTSARSESISHYQSQMGGQLILRYRQTVGVDVLPGDLFPNVLAPAPRLAVPKPPEALVGMLDFDHILKTDVPLDANRIAAFFRKLQHTTSAAFRVVTTPDAMQLWKGIR